MSNGKIADDARVIQECRSKRLKILRKMSEMSRRSFAEKHGISQGTLQNWETSRFGGLTEKGARRMLKALQGEGIYCSFEWLMYGFGEQPRVQNHSENKVISNPLDYPANLSIDDELRYMSQLHSNSIYMIIDDNSMSPEYNRGDYVFGIKYTDFEISSVIRQVCIVELLDATKLLRYIRPSYNPGRYDLIATNPIQAKSPMELNTEIVSVAPIIWIRVPESA
ncbi:MAG TPA: hypothetical protein QF353_03905 [Gammaproteobacteria bacterium]|nr:hypothetical protein [Gammaproteobacteria bacterium]